jgi:dGTP triphosphohydrolase
VRLVYRHYLEHAGEIESDFVIASDPPWRRAADYVAGMTDGFALETARRLSKGDIQASHYLPIR